MCLHNICNLKREMFLFLFVNLRPEIISLLARLIRLNNCSNYSQRSKKIVKHDRSDLIELELVGIILLHVNILQRCSRAIRHESRHLESTEALGVLDQRD